MPEQHPPEKSIFLAAIEIASATERARFLDTACAGNRLLRAEVQALLDAHDKPQALVDAPLPGLLAAAEDAVTERPGTVIGPYKMLQQIGEGGMGTVFMAEQTHPVQRKVALKIIKPGMDSRQVIARFEAERQALALMEHPNIARVLDAGTTTSGRPYFVMELVKGVPITRYCDDHHLTPRQRLELFVPVCQAVQHAHQKGIIHRDLKPSNVLVAEYDDKPVAKVIDFGVAKATGPKLTDRTMYTEFGQVVGTVEYMSPEQAKLNALDIDTRSDIYALGVLLYELLTGTTPFEKKRLQAVAFDEVLRIIREEEPPKPSTRLSTIEELPSIAANRGLEPKKLTGLLRGELDWIVMKALEKDRNRRYETANGFAMDIQRYLADEPVQACPPSAWYRFGKFARRNKTGFAIAGMIVFCVVLLGSGIGWLVGDRAARRAEITRQVQDLLTAARSLLAENQVARSRQKLAEARSRIGEDGALLGNLADEVEALDAELSTFERFLGLDEKAHEAEFPPSADLLIAQGAAAGKAVSREPAKAVPYMLGALSCFGVLERDDWSGQLERGRLGPDQVARVRRTAYDQLLWLADDDLRRRVNHRLGRQLSPPEAAQEALAYLRRAESGCRLTPAFYQIRGRCRKALGEAERARQDEQVARQTPATVARDHYLLALAAYDARNKEEAVRQCEAALRLEPTHYWSLYRLGACCDLHSKGLINERGSSAEAVGAYTGCILKRPDHAWAYFGRGNAYFHLNRHDDAAADYREAIRLQRDFAEAHLNLGSVLLNLWKLDESVAECREALRLRPDLAEAYTVLGRALLDQDKLADAVLAFREAVRLRPDYAPDQQPPQRQGHLPWALWRLAAFPYPEARNPKQIVELAEQATELLPKNGTVRLALGMAQYRAGNLQASLENIEKAITLSKGGDPSHWLALAMVHWRLGDKAKAAQWYEKANALMLAHDQYRVPPDWPPLRVEAGLLLDRMRDPILLSFDSHNFYTISGAAWSADGRRVLSGGDPAPGVWLWDAETGKELRRFSGHTSSVTSVAFSPDGRQALSGSEDKTVRLWDVETGKELRRFEGHTDRVTSVTFSPDGRRVPSGSADQSARLWDADTGQELRRFEGHTYGPDDAPGHAYVHCVAFSPDGKRALTGESHRTIMIWDVGTGKELRRLTVEDGDALSAVFSPDGRQVLSCSGAKLRLWDVDSAQVVRLFRQDLCYASGLAFSRDGRWALSADGAGRAFLWDVATGNELYRFVAHSQFTLVEAVAFSSDGCRAFSASNDGTMYIWKLPAQQENAPPKD
jgi:serine/threonine protein kinase/Tfp pilus assembly protein PilF/sugar lactone lactonase YvrE